MTGHDALDHHLAVEIAVLAGGRADVAADRAVRANARHFGQFPGTRAEPEIGGGQRPDRANIGRVAAEIRVELRVADGHDLQAASALVKGQHRVTHQFVLETGTASALDAAFTVQVNQIAQRVMLRQMNFVVIGKPRRARSVAQRQILQRTFATLVADRAVERMAGQQKLDNVVARVGHLLGRGADGHALADIGGAGRRQFGLPAHNRLPGGVHLHLLGVLIDLHRAQLDQAHPAHADRRQLRMIAKNRDVVTQPAWPHRPGWRFWLPGRRRRLCKSSHCRS